MMVSQLKAWFYRSVADIAVEDPRAIAFGTLPRRGLSFEGGLLESVNFTNALFSDFQSLNRFFDGLLIEVLLERRRILSQDLAEPMTESPFVEAFKNVLQKKARMHGWRHISFVHLMDSSIFRSQIVQNGELIVENSNWNTDHGRLAHLLQFLYLAHYLDAERENGFTRSFIQRLGDERYFYLWEILFEGGDGDDRELGRSLKNPVTWAKHLHIAEVEQLPFLQALELIRLSQQWQ